MMTPEEQQQMDDLKRRVDDLTALVESAFNSDGTLKIPMLTIEADGDGSTPGGSVRMLTNLGPKDFITT